MIDSDDLIGMKDERLRILAPDATHQHFKGGLYRFLGPLCEANTGEYVLGKDRMPRIAYVHCYPYGKSVWVRDSDEWYGMKDGAPRFRKIEGTV